MVSLGIPPAECNSIAAWYGSSSRSRENSDCSSELQDQIINLTLTRCCASSDSGIEFDTYKEEAEAKCFLNDLDKLLNCLNCDKPLLGDSTMACAALIERVDMDIQKSGGCYSATVSLSHQTQICCTEIV